MKNITVLLMLIASVQAASAQNTTDTISIKETVLNYIEGFYANNFQRIEKAVYPELAKRVKVKDDAGNVMLRNIGTSELSYNAKKFNKG